MVLQSSGFPKKSFDEINASVAKAARLDVHFSPEVKVVNNKTSKSATKQTPPPAVQSKKIPPRYIISTLVPSEVHRLTGFADIVQMLSFAIILCEGDINLLTATTSALTWLEEWVLYFEFAYGRTTIRWGDFSSRWRYREQSLRSVVKTKLQLVVATRERWPTDASLREDEDLRKASWNEMFKDLRVRMIMHDMTDVPLPHPSDAELNRATYSKYYGGNCGEGGIFTQPCGWEGTLELFTGSVGDSDYVRSSKMLEHQEEYQNSDPQRDGTIILSPMYTTRDTESFWTVSVMGNNFVGSRYLQGVIEGMARSQHFLLPWWRIPVPVMNVP